MRYLLSPAARHTILATSLTTVASVLLALATRWSPMVLRDGIDLPTPARIVAVVAASSVLAAITWRVCSRLRWRLLKFSASATVRCWDGISKVGAVVASFDAHI